MATEEERKYQQRKKNTKKAPSSRELLGRQLPGTQRSGYVNAPSEKLAETAKQKAAPTITKPEPTPDVEPQKAKTLGDIEKEELAKPREPLPSQIEGPPSMTQSQKDQMFGERQKPTFGAFDAQGNRFGGSANQRNQAGAGNAGSYTGDASGTGAASGTFSTVSGSDPFEQLAKMRSLRDSPSGGSSGGFAIAPNTEARERNARLNDPRRQAISELQRQARLGNISQKNAYRTIENLMGQQTNENINDARLAQDTETAQMANRLGYAKIDSAEGIAADRLKSDSYQEALNRLTDVELAGVQSQQDQQKLGMDAAKFQETVRSNLTNERINQAKLSQQGQLEAAKLLQAGQIAAQKGGQNFAEFAKDVKVKMGEGVITKESARGLAEAYPMLGMILFPDEYTTE